MIYCDFFDLNIHIWYNAQALCHGIYCEFFVVSTHSWCIGQDLTQSIYCEFFELNTHTVYNAQDIIVCSAHQGLLPEIYPGLNSV